jgi:hypothetical protein
MKKEVYVRMANESAFYSKILANPDKFENPHFIKDEVFCSIDGVRVAIKKEDWYSLREETKIENL